ncbi:MAG: hypothetical protein IJT55_03040 [Prevotella sp.]|nr:hypothetical protein [Prevotella sp.]MBP3827213.1 hypothetical protein [Prevotella sp.]MBQ4147000.1 hypothetical protein [Prevotella sp.]MBQ7716469.1 hypothetical protein [Prevotella sp.]MBQ9222848.1 hypothetical protein [Prevotella sp.]
MKLTERTSQQIERFITKIAQKFPTNEDTNILTDIHLRVIQDSGEMLAFDDDDQEITRCVIEDWIDNKEENFYEESIGILRKSLQQQHDIIDKMGILKPFSFVMENDDQETVAELYVADDDTVIIGGDIMENLDKDLDDFFANLMKE